MRRISVPLYAPILVMVIVVAALVNVGGVALSAGSDNRPRNAPTPVLVATQVIPAGTPVEHLPKLMTTDLNPARSQDMRQVAPNVLRSIRYGNPERSARC